MAFSLKTAVVGQSDDGNVIAIALINADDAVIVECDPTAAMVLWEGLGSALRTRDSSMEDDMPASEENDGVP